MRIVGRGLALLLVVGAVLSAVTGDGFARVLGAIAGYADFGYAPQQCGVSTKYARAINGEKVRVCQDILGTSSGFYAGHELYYGVGLSYTDFRLSLPDTGDSYQCCAHHGTFDISTFDQIVGGAGTTHAKGG